MRPSTVRGRVFFLAGLLFVTLLVVACASGTQAPESAAPAAPSAAPAPAPAAPSPVPAPAAAPAPAAPAAAPASPPGTILAPTTADKAEAAITFANLFATRTVPGGPKINPIAMEKEKGVQELLKYHVNRLPLWTKAKYGGEAVFCCSVTGGLVDPTTDPLRIGTRRNANYGRLLYFDQGLCSWVGRDGDFSTCKGQYAVNDAVLIVPGIFQRWEQPDPVTYIFHVRKGVLWPVVPPMARTDREVTAEDVKWYIDIQQREGVYKDSFVDVKSTEATDRYTLKVNMLAPLPDFLRSIAQSGIGLFPKECYDEKGCLGQKLITPGPWLVKEYTARQKLVYEKNPEFFFKGLPYVDRWVILQITDPASQKTAFITGQVTNYRSYQRDEALSVGARVPGYKIHLQYNAAGPIGFRAKLDGPFADVRVRRALMMALDLRGLWELASSGNGVVPTEFGRDLFGFGKSFYFTLDNATEWYQYNPERAKRLLAEAGYPNGFTTKMATSSASGVLYEFILGVQGEWKKNLNIEMPIQAVDAIAFRNLLTEKKWEGMHFSAGAGAWTDGNTGFLTLLKGSPFNYQDIDDPVINDLYLKARRELDPDKRAALIWQAEQHEMNQIYWFRLDQHFPYDLMQPWEMNGASHAWDFYYSLGVVWLTMLDPDKVKK